MNQVLNLNFMEPLKSVLSGGWSVMVTWLSEWNRVEALAADTPSLPKMHALPLLGEVSTHLPWNLDMMAL